MRSCFLALVLLFGCCSPSLGGKRLRVLFIGNSYTQVNNLPQVTADIAASMGDTLQWQMEAPGGTMLFDHCSDPATISAIQAGNWDYVVLQEQSLIAAMPEGLVENFFVYCKKLDSLINQYNPCAETMLYMTWGRKNGHADMCTIYSNPQAYGWPHFCTYHAMDGLIRLRYRMMADTIGGVVSPVGAVWRCIRANYPSIGLYDADESHPSPAGTYAAACCFYTTLFKRNPELITYDFSVGSTDAANIRSAARRVTYDSMQYWHIDEHRTEARFTYALNAGVATFAGTAANASGLTWYFGDGQTSTALNPVHAYNAGGSYQVVLVVVNSSTGCKDTAQALLNISTTGIHPLAAGGIFSVFPNPTPDRVIVSSDAFLSGDYLVGVVDASGQTVNRQPGAHRQQQIIDLTPYSGGLYWLVVIKGDQVVYRTKVEKR